MDEEAAVPVEVVEVPEKLLRVSESSSNCRGGVTPTNELFEQDRKANGSGEPERVLFHLAASSEDDESLGGGEKALVAAVEEYGKSCDPFGRQQVGSGPFD